MLREFLGPIFAMFLKELRPKVLGQFLPARCSAPPLYCNQSGIGIGSDFEIQALWGVEFVQKVDFVRPDLFSVKTIYKIIIKQETKTT